MSTWISERPRQDLGLAQALLLALAGFLETEAL
jgi:hypothetical protein